MKIYILLCQFEEGDVYYNTYVSEDISKIQNHVTNYMKRDGIRCRLEVWKNGECVCRRQDDDIPKFIQRAKEINTRIEFVKWLAEFYRIRE